MNEVTMKFYTIQSKFTDLNNFTSMLCDVPDDLATICEYVRNVVEHFHGLNSHKIKPQRFLDVDIRYNAKILQRLYEKGYQSIAETIKFGDKIIGTCRTQSVLFCGILRAKGIPARVRYKYCTYFIQDFNHEQVVVEYWHSMKNRWIVIDPAMNFAVMKKKNIPINFDLFDVPESKSMPIAMAWLACRKGQFHPNQFGAVNKNQKRNGLGLLRIKLYHDLACLNKIEVVEWDRWNTMIGCELFTQGELSHCDYLAQIMHSCTLQDEIFYKNIHKLENYVIPVIGLAKSPYSGDYEVLY